MNTYTWLASFYDQHTDEVLLNTYQQIVASHPNKVKALDIGCGTGQFTTVLKPFNEVKAFDLNEAMVEIAQQRLGDMTVFKHDMTKPLDDTFDVIIATTDVFNHITSFRMFKETLFMWYKHLTTDGIMVFDLLKPSYLKDITGHQESFNINDTIIEWSIVGTNNPHTIKHVLNDGHSTATHLERAYTNEAVKTALDFATHVDVIDYPERTIYVIRA